MLHVSYSHLISLVTTKWQSLRVSLLLKKRSSLYILAPHLPTLLSYPLSPSTSFLFAYLPKRKQQSYNTEIEVVKLLNFSKKTKLTGESSDTFLFNDTLLLFEIDKMAGIVSCYICSLPGIANVLTY